MEYTRSRASVAERERDWQMSVPARRPRNDYEYEYTRDGSLSDVYVNPREHLRLAERGGDRVGVRLLDSDSHRLDPVIGRRVPVDDLQYLPEDASNTLFVMGVPSDCTSREATHIFFPFRGFKEVRVVKKPKESKKSHGVGEREAASAVVVLCFVEFDNPKCAAIAMEVLQGYKFDENDRDSPSLKLQFDRERSRSSFAHDRDRGRDYYRHRR